MRYEKILCALAIVFLTSVYVLITAPLSVYLYWEHYYASTLPSNKIILVDANKELPGNAIANLTESGVYVVRGVSYPELRGLIMLLGRKPLTIIIFSHGLRVSGSQALAISTSTPATYINRIVNLPDLSSGVGVIGIDNAGNAWLSIDLSKTGRIASGGKLFLVTCPSARMRETINSILSAGSTICYSIVRPTPLTALQIIYPWIKYIQTGHAAGLFTNFTCIHG